MAQTGKYVATAGRTHLGIFRLVRQIRAGQTCQLWLAMNSRTNQRVALKILKDDFRRDRVEIAQLKHEFNVGSQFNNPHIIKIFEFNVAEKIPYLALEYFGPRNLKQLLHEGIDQLAPHIPRFVEHGASGLGYLHGQGWLHRDVKPDNFMINENGDVKLIDFSLAQRSKKGLARLFGRSKVQGTRSYMAPEQIRGEMLDERTDVYSLGCTIYELVHGRPPYTAESANDLLHKHLKSSIPILRESHGITEEFSNLVARLMAKDPKDRPSSMQDILTEFKRLKVYRNPPSTHA